jgi:BNR repeat-like domain
LWKKILKKLKKEKVVIDPVIEQGRTNPDYIVYIPKSIDGSTYDTGNEHFLVFVGGDSQLKAVWTQSSAEGKNDQRIVFSYSEDSGVSWAPPKVIAGEIPPQKGPMASWGFPLVSQTGRIYVIYNRHVGKYDTFFHTTGKMEGIYSDDHGNSWSKPQEIPMERSIYDNPDLTMPSNWIVWQKPLRLSEGKYYCGFTRWVSKEVRHPPPDRSWTAHESVVEFMRFENVDENPEPSKLIITYIAQNEKALRVSYPGHPELSVVQEPSIVKLPDDRLFCVMRTTAGSPYYSISTDHGFKWTTPIPLKMSDEGSEIKQPLSPCPIYQIDDAKFIFLGHNHDGHFQKWKPKDTHYHRRPINLFLGEFKPNATQPIWFAEPEFLMDHTGIGLGLQKRHDLAMYASFTNINNKKILWYPDRKFFLLGKEINK